MTFWLGVHDPSWLATAGVPLMVSRRRLVGRRTMPAAAAEWVLDSGAYTELRSHGQWTVTPARYAREVRHWMAAGRLAWCCPQDWPCGPQERAATGLTVAAHQQRTVASYLRLRDAGLPVVPVLQGWDPDDYLRCLDAYLAAGTPAGGLWCVGSIAGRQATDQAAAVVAALHRQGLALHGLGVKVGGLREYGRLLASADSMAWSLDARRAAPLPGCRHASCANCLRYALRWRDQIGALA